MSLHGVLAQGSLLVFSATLVVLAERGRDEVGEGVVEVRSISFSASSTRLRALIMAASAAAVVLVERGERAVGVGAVEVGVAEVGVMEEMSPAWASLCTACSLKLASSRSFSAVGSLRPPVVGWRRGGGVEVDRVRAMLTSLKRSRSETRSRSE